MASHTLRDGRFPPATNVSAYPQTAKQSGGPPGAAAVAGPVAVAADGTLTFVGLQDGVAYTAYASVGGVHTYADFTTDPAGAKPGPVVAGAESLAEKKRRLWLPNNAVDETIPRVDAVADVPAVASGTVILAGGLILPAGKTVSKIGVVSGTTAAGTPTLQKFAIVKADQVGAQQGVVQAVTVDGTNGAWAANTLKELDLTRPFTPADDLAAWLAVLVVAGTPPSYAGALMKAAAIAGIGASDGGIPPRAATAATGQADMPLLVGARTAIAGCFYGYVR